MHKTTAGQEVARQGGLSRECPCHGWRGREDGCLEGQHGRKNERGHRGLTAHRVGKTAGAGSVPMGL